SIHSNLETMNKDIYLYYMLPTFYLFVFFFSSRRRHTSSKRDWSSDVCSSDLTIQIPPIQSYFTVIIVWSYSTLEPWLISMDSTTPLTSLLTSFITFIASI